MTDDTLTALTDAANARLAARWREMEIDLPTPHLSPGMVRCVVEAMTATGAAEWAGPPTAAPAATPAPRPRRTPAERLQAVVNAVTAVYTPAAPAQDEDATPAKDARAASDLDEAAIIAHLRELSPDGATMPPATAWNTQRGSLPHSSTLYTRRKWSEWAQLAGLRVLSPRERALARQDGGSPLGAAADHTPTAQLLATLPPPEDTPTPPPRPPRAMVVDEGAAVAELQRLAVDGIMPSRIAYDTGRPATATATSTAERVAARKAAVEAARAALLERTRHALAEMAPDGHMPALRQYDAAKPADLPLGGELLHRLGLDSWGELAHACGLAYRPGRAKGHRNGNHTAQAAA